jgi:hypothetical protein
MRGGRVCSSSRETRDAYRIMLEKLVGKRPPGKSRNSSVDNIKMDFRD